MLPHKILKMEPLRLTENAFYAYSCMISRITFFSIYNLFHEIFKFREDKAIISISRNS